MGPTKFEEQVAECVGLWLAEGSTTSKSEITFTNNCLELIDLFYNTINELFRAYSFNQRIYVYSKDGQEVKLPYNKCAFKYYVHQRATRPYFIFRIASVELIKKWKVVINETLKENSLIPFVLRGFFAGEGNVYEGKRSVRVLRISQKTRKDFIDNLLNSLGLIFSFEEGNRNYILSSKHNWDIFARYNLADLHPNKKEKFWRLYNSYKEEHYKKNYLYLGIYKELEEPLTTLQLSKRFNRSFARIQDVLVLLKKEGKIYNFRVQSRDYWVNNREIIIISKIKNNYLDVLKQPKLTSEIAKAFKVDWKSSFRRLNELKKLNLVQIGEDNKWKKKSTKKKIIVF